MFMCKKVNKQKTLRAINAQASVDVLGYINYIQKEGPAVNDYISLRVLENNIARLWGAVHEVTKSVCAECSTLKPIEKQGICKDCWADIRVEHLEEDDVKMPITTHEGFKQYITTLNERTYHG